MFSSLDTDTLVKSMTSGEQARIDTVRQKQTRREWYNESLTSVKTEISDFLNTYMSATGENSMLRSAAYATFKSITSSTSNAAAVSGSSAADMGNITLQINRLAKNASVTSLAKVSGDGTEISSNNNAALGSLSLAEPLEFNSSGEISFAINGKTFSFRKDTTLQNMINTVNTDTTANVTMKYSRLTDTFSITADSGGADSSVKITNLEGNAFGTNSAFGITEGTAKNGVDSEAVINGVTVTRDSNEYKIDGITYELKKVTQGTSEPEVTYSLERDYSETISNISKFVDGYNKLFTKLNDLVGETDYSADYPPLTDAQKSEMTDDEITAWEKKAKSGLLKQNKDLVNLISNLKSGFYTALGGIGKNATEIGLSAAGYYEDNAGQIVIDEEKLSEALKKNPDEVITMFTNGSTSAASSEQGLIYKLRSSLTTYSSNVTSAMKTAKTQINQYDKEIDGLEDKLGELAERYYAKFSRMETALSKLNSQASYISQLFQ
jgi:flagellar hook-associated protein 2